MSQEMKEAGKRACYACIQWDGQRSYYADKQIIKVDPGKEGLCRVSHKKVRGSSQCESFYALR
ncbi:MAG TPA: hypothetical protein PLC54_01085 [Spirochaetales bacterium]|nr:hypothetical protein [Spirochaetales bacterium]